MKITEQVEMIRLMANELADSVKTYDAAYTEHKGYVCVSVVAASDTKSAISRKILHMRQALLDLEGKL